MPPLIQTAGEAREHAIRAAIQAGVPTSGLLSLPFEVRSEILKLALPSTFRDENNERIWQLGSTTVLRTCQQLHAEGAAVLYANPFTLQLSNPMKFRSGPDQSDDAIVIRFLNPRYRSRRGCQCCRRIPRTDCRRITNERCRDKTRGWTVLQKELPLAEMAPANVGRMQRWILELWDWGYLEGFGGGAAGLMGLMRELGIESELEFFWKVGKLVRAPLRLTKQLKKVTLQWTGDFPPESEIERQRFRTWISLPFEMKGIVVEEDTIAACGGW